MISRYVREMSSLACPVTNICYANLESEWNVTWISSGVPKRVVAKMPIRSSASWLYAHVRLPFSYNTYVETEIHTLICARKLHTLRAGSWVRLGVCMV